MSDIREVGRPARLSDVDGRVLAVLVVIAAITVWTASGVTLRDALVYLAYWVFVIALPGRFIWRGIMRKHEASNPHRRGIATAVEEWSCGAAVGYALEIPSYVVARSVGFPFLYLIVPAGVLAANAWFFKRRSQQIYESTRMSGGSAAALSIVVVYLIVWVGVDIFTAHPLSSGIIVDPDEMFHLALIGELRHHFPATYPYLEYPGSLTYQWFVNAHMSATSWATGLSPDVIYRRFDPLVLTVLTVVGASAVGIRISKRAWCGPVTAGILVLVGSFDISGALPEEALPEERFLLGLAIVHSPTQTFASMLAIPVMLLALELVGPGVRSRMSTWLALLAGMMALSGAKVTYLPMFACGFIAVLGVRALRQRTFFPAAAAGFALALSVVFTSAWLLYGGDSQSLGVYPLQTSRFFMARLGIGGSGLDAQLVVAAALLVMWLVPGAGILGLLRMSNTRWDPRAWWLSGTAVSGYGATMLLGHGGNSQLYFGRSAALPLAVASAWGIVAMFPRKMSRREALKVASVAASGGMLLFGVRSLTERWRAPALINGDMVETPALRLWVNLIVLLVLILVATIAHIAVRDLSGGRRSLQFRMTVVFVVGLGLARAIAFVTPPVVDPPGAEPRWRYGADGREAAEWLRLHSDPSERIMTNAHCGPVLPAPSECDARHFWMSALTERRFVLEGWAYTARSGAWTDDFWGSPELLRANDAVFAEPSERSIAEFARRYEVRWLFVDRRFPVQLGELRQLENTRQRHDRGHYSILEIVSSCNSVRDKC